MGRTRKSIVAISAGLVSVLIMAGVAAASRGGDSLSSGRPARVEDNSVSTPSTTTATSTSTDADPTGGTAGPSTTIEPGDDNGVDTPTTFDDNGNDTSTTLPDDTSTSVPDHPGTTIAPVETGERTFTVAGGSVVVNVNADRSLTLVSVTPNAGVEVKEQRSEGDEVRVEFRGPDGDSRVRVRFDDGSLRIETRDN